MFMTAYELFTEVPSGDAFGLTLAESTELATRKLEEARTGDAYTTKFPALLGDESLYDSIAKNGVTSPVILAYKGFVVERMPEHHKGKAFIHNGNHRVVAAYHIDPTMLIEVEYL
jgi:hypothetical protein